LQDIIDAYDDIPWLMYLTDGAIGYCEDNYTVGGSQWRFECAAALRNMWYAIKYLTYGHYPFSGIKRVPYYLEHCVGGDEFSMEILFTAYLDAKDDERSAWQLLTDAYQASMYDKPFDLEYHKTWVARFKEWA